MEKKRGKEISIYTAAHNRIQSRYIHVFDANNTLVTDSDFMRGRSKTIITFSNVSLAMVFSLFGSAHYLCCSVNEEEKTNESDGWKKKRCFFCFMICLHVWIKHKNLHVFTLKLTKKKQSNGRKKTETSFFSHHSLSSIKEKKKQNYHMRDLSFFLSFFFAFSLFCDLICEDLNSTFFFSVYFFLSFSELKSERAGGRERAVDKWSFSACAFVYLLDLIQQQRHLEKYFSIFKWNVCVCGVCVCEGIKLQNIMGLYRQVNSIGKMEWMFSIVLYTTNSIQHRAPYSTAQCRRHMAKCAEHRKLN